MPKPSGPFHLDKYAKHIGRMQKSNPLAKDVHAGRGKNAHTCGLMGSQIVVKITACQRHMMQPALGVAR
jgi:hypothetical protein